MDYRRFLGKTQTLELAWLGGTTVSAPGRWLRLGKRPPRPGWYRFEVTGRVATPLKECEVPDLTALPAVRGWLLGERLVREGAAAELVSLLPAEEPPMFSPATARRWHSGELVFESLDFESEAEGAVRQALGEGAGLSTVKGVPAPLRAAYAYALVERASRQLQLPCAPGEVRARVGEIAQGGPAAAEAAVRALEAERELARRELEELERQRRQAAVQAELELERGRRVQAALDRVHRDARNHEDVERQRGEHRGRNDPHQAAARAEEALAEAGAILETARRLQGDVLEVVFRFMGQRFISTVDAFTLQVIDSGICLGHPPADKLITLDSLPSVIREAIDDGVLVILRHP